MLHRIVRCCALSAVLGLPVAGTRAAEEAPPSADITALRQELDRLRTEMGTQRETYDARIAALKLEIELLRDTANGGSPAEEPPAAGLLDGEDELENVLEELGEGETEPSAGESPAAVLGDEGDELESVLGDLTSEEDALVAAEPSFASTVGQAFQSFNPNISTIADVLVHYSNQNENKLDDVFIFRELELGFSAAIDPYARADFFLSLGQNENGDFETAVEEGYATFLTIPWDLQPRLGQIRSTFGKANALHQHAIPWVEYPLVIQNFFGPDGLYGVGGGVNWLVPNPWEQYIELTYELTNNHHSLFADAEPNELVHLLHLKNFLELSDSSTVEVGLSIATEPGLEKDDRDLTVIEGADLTLKWRPPQAALYRAFTWQTEVVAGQIEFDRGWGSPWGLFSAAEYQFARRWSAGGRYDFTRHDFTGDTVFREHAGSAYLTFIQSEFLFWRLSYRYTDHDSSVRGFATEHQVFLQCNFGIGPHRAHKY